MNTRASNVANRARGSALIAIVAAVLLFSVLAAALVTMVGSAGQQTAFGNLADRAYYLAESGYRYAMARFRQPLATDVDDMDALENMEGEHALDGDEGRFELKVYSFFYLTTAVTLPEADSLTVHAPGSFPKDEIANADLDGQQVEIDGTLYTLGAASNAHDDSEDLATFYVTPALPTEPLPLGTMVYAATRTDTDQTLSSDGELSYNADAAEMFPLRNGLIRLQGGSYLTYRINDRAAHKFVGVRATGGSDITGMSVPSDATIVLMPCTRIQSTGVAGGDGFEAQREVIYSGGLPWSEASRRITFEDKFDAGTGNWNAAGSGTHTIATDVGDGNQALQITSSSGESLATLDTGETQENFNGFRTTSGNYLSYDVQVKVGFYGTTTVPSATNPMPVDVAAGLSFRLNNLVTGSATATYNGYGLSFVKGDGSDSAMDGILPTGSDERTLTSQPLIVLWQQTGDSTTRQWLAYKKIQWDYFENFYDMDELASPSWQNAQVDPLWEISAVGYGCLRFKSDNVGQGAVESPEIDLTSKSGSSGIVLTFDSRDDNVFNDHDRWIQVLTQNADDSWSETDLACDSDTASACYIPSPRASFPFWRSARVDLTAYGGKIIKIRFVQNSPAALDGTGWYIDEVAIQGEQTWTVQDATLAVRLLEAAVVQFEDGAETPFAMGDWIRGSVTGTTGTVVAPPIFSDPVDTRGSLLLNDLSGSGFSAGETLQVLNSASDATATVAASTSASDLKDNIIRVYYASADGNGTEDDLGDPLDRYTLPYPRLGDGDSLIWPVDDGEAWTSENDYFRLIQWDGINAALSSSLGIIASSDAPNAALRHYNTDLQSQFISAASPELGLHAYGSSTDVAKIYFDDFGYQLIMSPLDLYPDPLQQ